MDSAPFSLLGVYVATQSSITTARRRRTNLVHLRRGPPVRGRRPRAEELRRQEGDRGRPLRDDHARSPGCGVDRVVGGFIVGLTSVGSGRFFGRTMLFVFSLSAHKVVGTDIQHAAALLYVAGFGHFIAGNIDMSIVGWLLIGSIPGILIGSHFSVRIPEAWLRLALADVLAISGSSSCRCRTSSSRSRSASRSQAVSLRASTSGAKSARPARSCWCLSARASRVALRGPCPACSRLCSSSRCSAGRQPRSPSRRA